MRKGAEEYGCEKEYDQYVTRVTIGLTLFLFVAIYLLMVKAGISSVRHLSTFLIASYLVLWGGYSLLSSLPGKEVRIRFILITLSLGMTLLLVESLAWTKVIDYRQVFRTSGGEIWERPGYLPDPELLAKPKPYYSAQIEFSRGNIGEVLCLPPHPAEPFELKYDKNGFRNDEDFTSAEIAVIGDSYVDSQMLPSSMLATTQLAELTQTAVANLGQSGYGPQQELAVLKRYALPLHPKSVVWVFYEGNDLRDAKRYRDRISALQTNRDGIEAVWDRSFTRNSLSWLTGVIRGCSPARASKDVITRAVVKDREQNKVVYLKGRSLAGSLTGEELHALRTSVAAIEEAYRLIHHKGGRLLIVFAPTAFRVYRNIADFKEAGDTNLWDLNDLPDRLRKMVSEISPDIDYLDLTPALESAARNNSLVFLPDDTHWSAEGHRVVAEALASALMVEPKIFAGQSRFAADKQKKDGILSTGAMMVRNLDGTIRYWSDGATKLYGWESQDALGSRSHHLLKTVFPTPLVAIEEELRAKGYWEGKLVHERRDGSKVTVLSRWDLQENTRSQERSARVIEINGPLQISRSGSMPMEVLRS